MSGFLHGIPDSQAVKPDADQVKQAVSPSEAQQDFADSLKKAINNVNDAQITSDKKTEAMAKGDTENLHDVMLSAQKSQITLKASAQVQRKVIDAYNEIMRMQI
ncbi:flagellar hook-basal body complex protein FliE [Barrientosiimonas marina]|uniref:Flagellar hook-basal body complex protein FliE n=1 Tax=Lentibacillus kimchii TaxID=1542911 RepID=A0ABW2UPJ5_9BACI